MKKVTTMSQIVISQSVKDMFSKFKLSLLTTLLTTGLSQQSQAQELKLLPASNLRQDALIAKHRGLVLLIEFSSESCEFCRSLEENFLKPMLQNDEYNQKVLIRYLSLDDGETLIDFDGKKISTKTFAARYTVSMTPTLVFLNSNGVEVSEKLIGIWSLDYYGSYIDQRIDDAYLKLQQS